jgi:hypothetical protein
VIAYSDGIVVVGCFVLARRSLCVIGRCVLVEDDQEMMYGGVTKVDTGLKCYCLRVSSIVVRCVARLCSKTAGGSLYLGSAPISSSHQEKVLQVPLHDVWSFAVNGSHLAVN